MKTENISLTCINVNGKSFQDFECPFLLSLLSVGLTSERDHVLTAM